MRGFITTTLLGVSLVAVGCGDSGGDGGAPSDTAPDAALGATSDAELDVAAPQDVATEIDAAHSVPDVGAHQDIDVPTPDAGPSDPDDVAPDAQPDVAPDATDDAATDSVPDVAVDEPSVVCAEPPPGLPSPSITGAGRFQTVAPLAHPGLLSRGLRVYLPADYDASDAHYPVVSMHDGQNLFQPSEAAFGVEWEVDEVLDQLVAQGLVEPHIVVGIDNTAERIADYTPNVDPQVGEGGKADLYAAFVADVVKPLIEQHFRVRCGPGDAALGGSSLGGLVSLHIALTRPDVFDRVAAVSPSLWWSDGWMVDAVADFGGELPGRVWIDGGTDEGSSGLSGQPTDLIINVRAVRDLLLADGLVFGDSLGALEVEGAPHNEAAWAARLPSVLGFLLGEARPADQAVTGLSMFAYADALTTAPGGGLGAETTVAVEAVHAGVTHLTWPNTTVTLASSHPDIAAIDEAGTVTAVAAGEASLTVSAFGLAAAVPLLVVADDGGALVTFEVDVPDSTPDGDLVHVSGDHPQLGSWSGAGLVLAPSGPSHFTGAVSLPVGTPIEFKFTRGTWATVEKSATGAELPNRSAIVSPGLVIESVVASWADAPP